MANKIEFIIDANDRASKKLGKSSASLKDFAKTALKASTAIAGTGAAVVGFTTAVAASVDRQGKFAIRLGLTTEELTRTQHAADLAGISTETFNMAVQRSTRRVAEAAKGMGEAAPALKELGINAAEFKRLNLDDKMAKLADAMEGVKDPADQLRLSFKLFDSEGTAMLTMLKGGSDAMRAAANDADFLGVTISGSLAAKSANMVDAMTRAGKSVKGVGMAIAEELMPFLAPLANGFADAVAKSRKHLANMLRTSINIFAGMHNVLKTFATNLIDFLSGGDVFNTFSNGLKGMAENTAIALQQMGQMIVRVFDAAFNGATDIVSRFGEWAFNAIANIFSDNPAQGFSEAMGAAFADAMQNIENEASKGFTVITASGTEAIESLGGSLDGFKFSVEDAFNAGVENVERMREVSAAAAESIKDSNTGTTENTLDMISILGEGWNLFYKDLGTMNETASKQLAGLMKFTVDGFSKSFASAIVSGKSLTDSLRNLSKQVLTEMVAMFVKVGIQHLITSKLMGTSEGARIGGTIYGNAFAATAAIPIVGPALAPAVAAASLAAGLAGMAASAATGAGTLGGVAHGGLDNVPRESTFLLDKGERVLSPRQNTDLTSFLNSQGSAPGAANDGITTTNGDTITNGGTTITIETLIVEVLPNATSADSLLALDANEMKEVVAGPIIQAFNELDNEGVRPNFVERQAV